MFSYELNYYEFLYLKFKYFPDIYQLDPKIGGWVDRRFGFNIKLNILFILITFSKNFLKIFLLN